MWKRLMNPGVTYLDWKQSSGWLESWEGLLLEQESFSGLQSPNDLFQSRYYKVSCNWSICQMISTKFDFFFVYGIHNHEKEKLGWNHLAWSPLNLQNIRHWKARAEFHLPKILRGVHYRTDDVGSMIKHCPNCKICKQNHCFLYLHRKCSNPVNYLRQQLLMTLQEVLLDDGRPFCSHYGAVVGLTELGSEVI